MMYNNFYGAPQQPYNQNYGVPFINNRQLIINNAKKNLRSHSIRIGICILVFLSSPYVLGVLLELFGIYDFYLNNTTFQYAVELLYSVLFLFLPFFIVYLSKGRDEKQKIAEVFEKPCSKTVFFTSIGFGLMLCYCGDFASAWISTIFESFGITLTTTADVSIPTSGAPLALFAISTAIAPAIIEEFTMRAVTMQAMRRYGDKFAIIMTALVFGLMHRNAVQGIFAFIAGVIFGYITVATGSIWSAVIVHCLNNGIYVIFNVANEINPGLYEKIYPFFLTAVFVIGLACSVPFVMSKKRITLRKAPMLPETSKKTGFFLLTVPMVIAIGWMLVYTLFVQI